MKPLFSPQHSPSFLSCPHQTSLASQKGMCMMLVSSVSFYIQIMLIFYFIIFLFIQNYSFSFLFVFRVCLFFVNSSLCLRLHPSRTIRCAGKLRPSSWDKANTDLSSFAWKPYAQPSDTLLGTKQSNFWRWDGVRCELWTVVNGNGWRGWLGSEYGNIRGQKVVMRKVGCQDGWRSAHFCDTVMLQLWQP